MAERLTEEDVQQLLRYRDEAERKEIGNLERGIFLAAITEYGFPIVSELEQLRKENQRLRQGLELTRMSVVLIMAREGFSREMDRDAKFSALKQIDDALEEVRRSD